MMIELLKKDWRVNRAAVVGALAVFLVIYFIAALSLVLEHKSVAELERHDEIALSFCVAANTSLAATVLIAGAIGGMAFAVERRERSADFLALLPASRRHITLSKTIVGVCIWAVLWALNCGVGFTAIKLSYFHQPVKDFERGLIITLIFIWMTFGTSWLLSTFLRSPTFACCIALGFTLGSNMVIALTAEHLHYTDPAHERMVNWIFISWSAWAGLVSYVAGTIYYLRRVEP